MLEVFADEENPDILCLSKYFVNKLEIKHIIIKDFDYITSFCRTQVGIHGVVVWRHPNLHCEQFSEEKECELPAVSNEINRYEKILLVVGYRTPTGNHDTSLEYLGDCRDIYAITHTDINIDLSVNCCIGHKYYIILWFV